MSDDTQDQDPTHPGPEGKALHPGLQNLLEKQGGDAMKLAIQLHGENFQIREDRRKLREELRDKVPPGAVVLKGDDVAAWNLYKQLGKPEELKSLQAKAEEATKKLALHERNAHLDSVAEAAGVKTSVLKTLAGSLAFEVKEGPDGKKAVLVKDGDGEAVEFTKVVDSKWADFKSALYPERKRNPAGPVGTPARSRFLEGSGAGRGEGTEEDAIRNAVARMGGSF